jgi:hypothetical protein
MFEPASSTGTGSGFAFRLFSMVSTSPLRSVNRVNQIFYVVRLAAPRAVAPRNVIHEREDPHGQNREVSA